MSAPAPARRSIAALTSLELRLLARRGENVLATLIIPVAVLLFFGGTSMLPLAGDPIPSLLPGTIALGIVAAGLVNLGIATAYERHYGVLKRLGGAPLPRWAFIAAKVLSVLVLEAVQVALLVAVAILVFHWSPAGPISMVGLVAALLLGTAAFVGLGLLLAGTLRAEAVLALANGLFLALLMVGGVVLPVDHLPELLQPVASVLPSAALADLLRFSLGTVAADGSAQDPARAVVVLAGWAIVATALAARTFRWDES